MSILFWSVESSIGRFREKGKELVIQEKQYKNFYFKYKKVKSLKVSTFNMNFWFLILSYKIYIELQIILLSKVKQIAYRRKIMIK